jgi:hypothetical protein
MSEKARAILFETPPNIVAFSPPPSASYKPIVNGRLEMLPLASVIGTVGHRFAFREPGGPGNLKPGRPLSQTMPINIPPNAGWFVMLNGFNHAFVHNDPPDALAERPLGQMYAIAGIDAGARNLVCNVRLTDSNSDDPIQINVDVVVVFFN